LEYLSLTNNTDLQVLRAAGNSLTNLNLSTNKRLVGKLDDDVHPYFVDNLWGGDCSTINLGDMPNLTEICVWEGFSLDSMVVVDDDEEIELIEMFELEGSPNVYFTTDCQYVDNVFIPDTAFLHALIEEGVDTNGDSLISFEEAERITSLTISNAIYMGGGGGPPWACIERSSLASLQGIEAFTNLDTLTCVCHSIETIDLSNNQKIKFLNLDFNQLTSLDVSNNIALTELRCFGNQLTSLDVSNNTGLEALDCSMNLLTSLNVTNNKALKHLACHGNQISELNLCNNSMLRNMVCSGNHLHFLDLSNNTKLEDFCLEDMPTLELVCVWEPTVRASWGSPNIVYTTECNYCLAPIIVSIDTLYQPEFIEVTSSEDGMIFFVPENTEQDMEMILRECIDSVEVLMNTPINIPLEGMENGTYWLYATDTTGNISEPKAFTVMGVGIEQRNTENLRTYPNPTYTLLTIETVTSDLIYIEVTSLNGQRLLSKEIEGRTHQLDLSSFRKGVYLITIRSKDFVTTRKIVKL
jgi:hypothetical protein